MLLIFSLSFSRLAAPRRPVVREEQARIGFVSTCAIRNPVARRVFPSFGLCRASLSTNEPLVAIVFMVLYQSMPPWL